MNIRNTIYLFISIALAACTADDMDLQLTSEQQILIGQGVNFNASMADQFVTRTTYHSDGSFNEGDQMRIFRQYAKSGDATGTTFDEDGEIFRTYYYKMTYAAGTSVSLNNDWLPAPKDYGKLKSDAKGSTLAQTEADSLTWENGRTVRFRAWGRSNLSGVLYATGTTDAEKRAPARSSYYPDYTVSDWVTVSGPTQNISLTMRHIACRIALTYKGGNQFSSVKLCTDAADYASEDDAKKVRDAYNKMCMPAGVDDKTFLLTAMTKELYNNENTNLNNIEQYSTGIVKIGEKTAAEIASDVQHPLFKNNNGNQYFMAIPFDMSCDNPGQELKLPACTRFKVWLYDVNNGSETSFHIFELSDIKNSEGETAFPDGLTLKAGYSFNFSVGYQYNQFTITAADNFNWDNGGNEDGTANSETQNEPSLDMKWFTDTYNDAVAASLADSKVPFKPIFNITTTGQLLTFAKLANGTALSDPDKIHKGELREDKNGYKKYYWYIDGVLDENNNPKQLTSDDANTYGYYFYYRFYPKVSTVAAYAEEECFSAPVDFKGLEVTLGENIDLADCILPAIGSDYNHPFRGVFNGNGKTLKNLYMQNGYLFENVEDGVITNLKIESIHNTCLINSAKASDDTNGWGCYVAGVSMQCPSSGNSIATDLGSNSYMVGCIHIGNAGAALVGSAYNLTMMGCMQAAAGITTGTGALLGTGSVKSTMFRYNYYDVDLSSGICAIGTTKDNYDYDMYIRGAKSHILKAKNDYLIGSNVDKTKLDDYMLSEMYGLAPWKAMNNGIADYNSSTIGEKYPCKMLYQTSTVGYTNQYPTLVYKEE